jgi:hypothetical protein
MLEFSKHKTFVYLFIIEQLIARHSRNRRIYQSRIGRILCFFCVQSEYGIAESLLVTKLWAGRPEFDSWQGSIFLFFS